MFGKAIRKAVLPIFLANEELASGGKSQMRN